MPPETEDPVVLLSQARKRYFLRTLLYLASLSIMVGINLSLENRIERMGNIQVANEHAIVNLVESSKKLQAACAPLINPNPVPLVSDGCHVEQDLMVCEELRPRDITKTP